jgi:hypothetical protein
MADEKACILSECGSVKPCNRTASSALLFGFPGPYILCSSGLLIVKSFNDLTGSWLVYTNKEPDCVREQLMLRVNQRNLCRSDLVEP